MLRLVSRAFQSLFNCVLESRKAICIVPSGAVTNLHPLCSRGIESDFQSQSWNPFFLAKHPITTDAFEAYDAAARELMLNQEVKATQLHKRLRDITEDASKDLPPLEVLYCSSYGGYGYSEEFERFIEAKKATPDSLATACDVKTGPDSDDFGYFITFSRKDRVRHVQWLAPFGQDVMDKWPAIAKLVRAYMRNDLGNIVDFIQDLMLDGQRGLKISKIREAIAAESGRIDGETEYYFLCLKGEDDFSVYAPSALEEMRKECDAKQSELTLTFKEGLDALLMHLTKAQIFAMVKSLRTKVAENNGEDKLDWMERGKMKQLSFIGKIAKYGEHHSAVWQHQGTFNEKAMRFLRLHSEHTERLASQGDNVDCARAVGLCAAGTATCYLEIAEVPRMSEWTVGEYDGKERVHLV